jgi:hypothetical protein
VALHTLARVLFALNRGWISFDLPPLGHAWPYAVDGSNAG